MVLPTKLARTVMLFKGAPKDLKLQALLEYSRKVPALPQRYADNRDLLEQVTECQTPFFLAADVADAYRSCFDIEPRAIDDGWVRLSGTRLS